MKDYLGYLIGRHYLRLLFAAYAFLVFFGVMPKAPPRPPFQSQIDYLFLTVTNALGGFIVLAVMLALLCAAWSAVAVAAGSKPPPETVPDEPPNGGLL